VLARSTLEECKTEIIKNIKAGFLTSALTGVFAIPFNAKANITQVKEIRNTGLKAKNADKFKTATKNTYIGDNPKLQKQILR